MLIPRFPEFAIVTGQFMKLNCVRNTCNMVKYYDRPEERTTNLPLYVSRTNCNGINSLVSDWLHKRNDNVIVISTN